MTEESDMVPPLTEATRARMVLADEAAEVADKARSLVSIGESELRPDGTARWSTEYVVEADALVAGAQRVLNAAAVFARCSGESWPQIGGALGMTKQSAQERFEPPLTQFREELHFPENPDWTGEFGQLRWRVHPAAGDPEGAAERLDEWLHARQDPAFDNELDDHPVSGGLARMDPTTELRWIADHGHQLWKDADARGTTVPIAERRALAQREVVLWQHLAAERPRSRTTRQALELAQSRVAELLSPEVASAHTAAAAERAQLDQQFAAHRKDSAAGTARILQLREEQDTAHRQVTAAEHRLTAALKEGVPEQIASAREELTAAHLQFDQISRANIDEGLRISATLSDAYSRNLEQMKRTWAAGDKIIAALQHPETPGAGEVSVPTLRQPQPPELQA